MNTFCFNALISIKNFKKKQVHNSELHLFLLIFIKNIKFLYAFAIISYLILIILAPVFPSISDLTLILTHVPLFLDTIIDFVWRFPPNVNNIKFMGLRCVNNLIEFKQLFIQKLWTSSSPLEQIEWGLDGEALKRKIKKLPQLSELIYLSSSELQKHSLFDGELGKCAENQLRQFPKIKLDVNVEVPEEKEIIQGDLISIKVRIERQHLEEKGKAKLVHAPKWPMPKEENWIIILCNVERNLVIELKFVRRIFFLGFVMFYFI